MSVDCERCIGGRPLGNTVSHGRRCALYQQRFGQAIGEFKPYGLADMFFDHDACELGMPCQGLH